MWLSLIFSGLSVFFIVKGLMEAGDPTGWWVGFAIFYIALIVEMFLCKTYKFLSNVEAATHVVPMINKMKTRKPRIYLRIQNYHYEMRMHHRNGRTEMRRERVNTHFAEQRYRFFEWVD